MKKIIIALCAITVFAFCSCKDDNDNNDDNDNIEIDTNQRDGYINISYAGITTELKEITVYPYVNLQRDTLGLVYTGYIDKYHLHKNTVALYISRESKLSRIHFYYSPPEANHSTLYENTEELFDNEATILKHSLSVYEKKLKGQFNGILFHAFDSINIDSCKFEIAR